MQTHEEYPAREVIRSGHGVQSLAWELCSCDAHIAHIIRGSTAEKKGKRQKREERKKQTAKLEGGQQRLRGRAQPAASQVMNYYEELGAKRESGDPSEEDADLDYPDDDSHASAGETYADEPRMARAAETPDASSHSAYGGAQGRPYADEDPSYQPRPSAANRSNRGAMRLLQGL